jgi:hypothetical protein
MSERREIRWPVHVLERIERLAAEAPPLTPHQQAVIRAACTPPRPAPKKVKAA